MMNERRVVHCSVVVDRAYALNRRPSGSSPAEGSSIFHLSGRWYFLFLEFLLQIFTASNYRLVAYGKSARIIKVFLHFFLLHDWINAAFLPILFHLFHSSENEPAPGKVAVPRPVGFPAPKPVRKGFWMDGRHNSIHSWTSKTLVKHFTINCTERLKSAFSRRRASRKTFRIRWNTSTQKYYRGCVCVWVRERESVCLCNRSRCFWKGVNSWRRRPSSLIWYLHGYLKEVKCQTSSAFYLVHIWTIWTHKYTRQTYTLHAHTHERSRVFVCKHRHTHKQRYKWQQTADTHTQLHTPTFCKYYKNISNKDHSRVPRE